MTIGDDKGFKSAAVGLKKDELRLKQFCKDNGRTYKPDRTAVPGYNKSVSGKVNAVKKAVDKENTQNFRPVSFGESTNIKRGTVDVTLMRSTSTINDIHISTGCNLSRKQLHQIDTQITNSLNKMSISKKDNLPLYYVLNHSEMQIDAIATYNAVTNVLTIDEAFGGALERIKALQKDGACPDNELSTVVHELFHWSDAMEYQKHHNKITSDNYIQYIEHLNNNRKKAIDKAGITEYNVSEISNYALESFELANFDEVFTEYRVIKLLRER